MYKKGSLKSVIVSKILEWSLFTKMEFTEWRGMCWTVIHHKNSMRPIMFLKNAYLSEHYKNPTGTKRKVSYGKIWGTSTLPYKF